MKILLVDDEFEILEILRLMAEGEFSATVLTEKSGNAAIRCLENNPDVSLIVSDIRMPDGDGYELKAYCAKKFPQVPFVFCSAEMPKDVERRMAGAAYTLVNKPDFFGPLLSFMRKHLRAAPPPPYCPVNVSLLLRMGLIEYELFIKLNDEKFVRVSQPGEDFTVDDARRFLDKNVQRLYLAKEDAMRMATHLVRALSIQSGPAEEGFELQAGALAAAWSFARVFGFGEQTCEIISANVRLASRFLQTNNKGFPEFRELLERDEGYFANHSVMLAYVAGVIAKIMSWDSEITYMKLAYAAVLHDISLSAAEIENIHTLEKNAMDPAFSEDPDVLAFRSHPFRSAEILSRLKDVPIETDLLVLQHHERPDGSGYPSRLHHSRLNPLASLLIFSCDLVDFLMEEKERKSQDELIREFLLLRAENYRLGHFKKIHQRMVEALT